MTKSLSYKTNFSLQRLRGFSILLVLGFHLQIIVPRFGYLGVDIFFVISGFLMYSLYPRFNHLSEVKTFYSRRIARIFPAFLFVIVLMSVIGLFVLQPFEKIELLRSLVPNSLFISNFSFWAKEQYFATSSFRPFLNVWSLCIEIQFYAVFPFLVKLLASSIKYRLVCVFIFFTSFVSTFLVDQVSPQTSFFFLPFRLWEFGIGIFIAWVFSKNLRISKKQMKRHFLSFIILGIFYLFESGLLTPTPFTAKFIVVSLSGIWLLHTQTSFEKLIPSRLLTLVGDYSYSIYLLHFPLIILINYSPFSGNSLGYRTLGSFFLIISLVISLSWAMRMYIEKPFLGNTNRVKQIIGGYLILVLVFATVQSNAIQLSTLGTSSAAKNIAFSQYDRSQFRCGTIYRIFFVRSLLDHPDYCEIGNAKKSNDISQAKVALLIGNSHADSIKEVFADVARADGYVPLLAQENMNVTQSNIHKLISVISKVNPSIILFHSRGGTYDLASMTVLFKYLSSRGTTVAVLESVPEYDDSIPRKLLSESRNAFAPVSSIEIIDKEAKAMEALTLKFGFIYLKSKDIFCIRTNNCLVADQVSRKPYYFDSNHLTLTGAKRLYFRLHSFFSSTE